MKANYEQAETRVLASEGGYTNDPRDPGGPTNWGITIYDARMYWKHNATSVDVKKMPKAVAEDIYRKKYWNALDCDDLPDGLDYCIFDYGVNSGIARAGKVLRKMIGVSTADWHVTPEVVAAVNRRDIKLLIEEVSDERLNFLHHLRTWDHFGRGWNARVASVRAASLQMEAATEVTTPTAQSVARAVEHPAHIFSHFSDDGWKAVRGAA